MYIHLIQAEAPKQQHKPTEIPLNPSPLQRRLSAPEGSPDSGRIGGCSDAPGPADLPFASRPCDGAPRPGAGLWVGDSRVAPYAVARWAFCCDLQLVRGNMLVVQCGPLIVQTLPAYPRISSA